MIVRPILATVLVALANLVFWIGDMSDIPTILKVFFFITSAFAAAAEWIDWWRDKDRY